MRLLTLSLDAFDGPVHTHPMLELTRIERGSGLRFIADTVEPFAAGDLVLVAPRVGHAWWTGRADRVPGAAAATVLQFHVAPVLDGLPEWMPTLGTLLQERAAAWVIHEDLARDLGPALQALAGTERLELLGL
ncbi:MAG: hypothetical protein K2X12_21765, partial [Burkholderiaceae bacterium]|nr:hypothetical protein [Burkholderiaceae bacterium]